VRDGDLLGRGLAAAPGAEFRVHSAVRPWSGTFADVELLLIILGAAGLARQKWPEEVHAADDFPRTPSGKIQKFRLRQDIAAQKS
jgi:acyl-CoA synthetase